MSEGMNRVTLLGQLGADPELRYGQGADNAVLKLRIACNESYFSKADNARKERCEWVNVVLFGRRAEALQKILAKGSSILVEGRLQTSSYENKEGQKVYKTEVVATNVILTGSRGDRANTSAPAREPAQRPSFGGGGGGGGARGPATPPALPADDGFDDNGGDDQDIPFVRSDVTRVGRP